MTTIAPSLRARAQERRACPGGPYTLLRYDGSHLPALSSVIRPSEGPLTVTVWLREADGALVGAVVRRSTGGAGESRALLRTVFMYDPEPPEIEAPTEFLDWDNAVQVRSPPEA